MLTQTYFADMWPLIWNFAQRDLRARYKRSLLGWAWSMINPLSVVLIYSLVFSVVFRVKPPETVSGNGQYFSIYLFSGLILWNQFTGLLNGAMTWLAGVSDLRKKIYFPTETALFGGAIATSTQTLLEVVVLIFFLVLVGNLAPTIVLLPIVLLFAGMFGLGIGFFVSILNAKYRDVSYLVGIGLNLGFYATPIIFTRELLEGKEKFGVSADFLLDVNPAARFVLATHKVAYIGEVPSASEWLVLILIAVITFTLGLWYFRKHSMAISEEL